MLNRSDKLKVPLVLLPNGSGNDYARSFHLENVGQGLEYIKRGHVIKVDIVKILLDHHSEDELREAAITDPSINIYDHMRYSAINCSLGLSANCARNAKWMKSSLGKHAYTIQTAIELIKGRKECYDLEIDDGGIKYSDQAAKFFWLYNGKFGGGGMVLSPFSVINDGFFEITLVEDETPFMEQIEFFDNVKAGGTQIYKQNDGKQTLASIRARKIVAYNKTPSTEANQQSEHQLYAP